MMPGQSVFVSPRTKAWATSAVVLGAIYFLLDLQNLFGYPKAALMFGSSKAAVGLISAIIDEIIAVTFIVTGSNALKGKASAREGLSYAAAGAMVMTLLGSVWGWILMHDPSFSNALTTQMSSANAASLPPNFLSIVVTISSVAIIVVGIGQLIYNFFLYRAMTAEEVEPPMPGASYYGQPAQGNWPPPPQQ